MNRTGKFINLALLISTIVFINACGFHLRGAGSLELPAGVEPISIIGIGNTTTFTNELNTLLKAYGVELATGTNQANHQLVIIEQKQDRRTAALGEGARVAEYQLTETVIFELRDKQGKTVLGPNTVTERKIIPNDPNKVVNTRAEEKILRREMLQNLAAKMTRQLQSFDYPATANSGQ